MVGQLTGGVLLLDTLTEGPRDPGPDQRTVGQGKYYGTPVGRPPLLSDHFSQTFPSFSSVQSFDRLGHKGQFGRDLLPVFVFLTLSYFHVNEHLISDKQSFSSTLIFRVI